MTERKTHWEKVYAEKTPQEVSWFQTEPTLSLRLIQHCGLNKEEAIIDVGGGASVLVDRLLDEGYRQLAVLDISANSLAIAKERLAARAAQVEWSVEDATRFIPPHSYALWHDRAVFHFLTEAADRKQYVEVLKRSLKSGGFVVLAAFAIGGPVQCSGLDIVQYDADKLRAELGDTFALIEEAKETHFTPTNTEQRFAYFRFQKNA